MSELGIVLMVLLIYVWNIMGVIIYSIKYINQELPNTILKNIVFHLVLGPISCIIGIGRLLYWLLNKI